MLPVLVQGAKGTVGALVRIVHAGFQPMWTRQLVGKVGVVVRNESVGLNRVYEVMVEGKIHRLHPLDVEAL